jgi:hypothetical protein
VVTLFAAWLTVFLQQPVVVADSIRNRLFVQGELTWYGTGPAADLSNRVVRIAQIRSLGFGGTRLPVEWVAIERVRGRRDWARLDSTVGELKRGGIQAYGIIAYSPRWAVPPEVAHLAQFAAHRPVVDGSSAKGDTLFAAFAAAAARRYHGFVDRWEIWNEENHAAFWINASSGTNQGADPADYAHLFSLARDSILAANPRAEVAVGGLTSFDGNIVLQKDPVDTRRHLSVLAPEAYIRSLLASGLRFSAVGLHPYSMVPPGVMGYGRGVIFPDVVVDSVLAVLRTSGLASARVWITEWGVHAPFAHSQQALDSWYDRALSILMCRPGIGFVTVHTLADANPTDHFGLVTFDGEQTANGLAFRHWLERWHGCPAK